MPGDRWLFGVLWGDDVAEPRSYIQAIPKVTLWLTQPETGRRWPAAWGRFYRCPMSTEHLALPLWPEDASALADGTVLVEVDVEALGMPRSRDMREVLDARSIEDAARRLLWLAFNFDEMAVPVDGAGQRRTGIRGSRSRTVLIPDGTGPASLGRRRDPALAVTVSRPSCVR